MYNTGKEVKELGVVVIKVVVFDNIRECLLIMYYKFYRSGNVNLERIY